MPAACGPPCEAERPGRAGGPSLPAGEPCRLPGRRRRAHLSSATTPASPLLPFTAALGRHRLRPRRRVPTPPQPAPPAPSGRRRSRARPVPPLPSRATAHGRRPRRAGAQPAPLRSMAKGPEQGDAFLQLPAAQAVPAEAQEERYAGLLGRGLLPCAGEALPEPPLSAGIKAGKGGSRQRALPSPRRGRLREPLLGSGGNAAARPDPQRQAGGAAVLREPNHALGSLFLSPAVLRNALGQRSPLLGRRGCGCSRRRADSRRPKPVFEEERHADHEGQEEADAAHPAMVGLQRAPAARPGGSRTEPACPSHSKGPFSNS